MTKPADVAISFGGGPGESAVACNLAGATNREPLLQKKVCPRFCDGGIPQPSGARFPAGESSRQTRFILAAGLCFLLSLTACRTPAPWSPVDTAQPGWRVLNGQAIWLSRKGAKEIAGDLLVALGPRDGCLVQLSKTPFPLVTAGVAEGAWQIEFGAGARRYSGRGTPPARFVWFCMADALRGELVRPPWLAEHPAPDHWRLANARTGERLEVWISP